ncbi:NrdH-redoxin [Oceanobacillus zhaokaii]|uniref:NrdH-redoxin n=1 Tax=Oceanobacillus zhaokaii TaxID=2052660 RepID=A0A345PM50_9BACI|nr:NrdH-redoxin [Oceanobacillus zhaokaii]
MIIYISENNPDCNSVLNLMDKLEVRYKTKNVTKNELYLQELQNEGIFGTPATFIEDRRYPILGFQKEKLKVALGKEDDRSTINSSRSKCGGYGN